MLARGDSMNREFSELEIQIAARVAHETNRAYCILLGDNSQRPWDALSWDDEADLKLIELGVAGVRDVIAGGGPESSHEKWMAGKLADGWKLGPVKDAEKKEHPSLVPYAELPEAERRKDAIFVGAVLSFLSALRD